MLLENKRLSASVWHDYHLDQGGQFHFVRLRIDWNTHRGRYMIAPWFAVDIGLLGLNLSLTYWPKGGE